MGSGSSSGQRQHEPPRTGQRAQELEGASHPRGAGADRRSGAAIHHVSGEAVRMSLFPSPRSQGHLNTVVRLIGCPNRTGSLPSAEAGVFFVSSAL